MARLRTERFNVYLSPDELLKILGRCGGRRNRVTCFLRDAALGRTIRPPVNISDETSRALSGISRNLNQALIIAHGGGVLNVATLAAMSADIAAIKKTIMG
ncbi:plasmid mobilization protein [Aeromonas allosaccharophila]|uniref:plasmid mobilization protein n=1 Tax=Aeromonas TaxID=642 RepID=UPI003B96827B